MRDHVTFTATVAGIVPTAAEEQGAGGAFDLARGLIYRLTAATAASPGSDAAALRVAPEPIREDWGWAVAVTCGGCSFTVGLGEYDADGEPGWLCFIESERSGLGRLLRGDAREAKSAVCTAVHEALAADPRIGRIRWHAKAEFMRGNERDWAASPEDA